MWKAGSQDRGLSMYLTSKGKLIMNYLHVHCGVLEAVILGLGGDAFLGIGEGASLSGAGVGVVVCVATSFPCCGSGVDDFLDATRHLKNVYGDIAQQCIFEISWWFMVEFLLVMRSEDDVTMNLELE